MSSGFHLSITPIVPTDLPSEEALIAAGRALLDSTSAWKKGKRYHGNVQTLSTGKLTPDGAPWHCRVSEHSQDEVTFDDMWSHLGKNKAENEKEYVHEIKKATLIKEISPTQSIWSLYYKFPPPIAPRVFTVLQTMYLEGRTGIIISVPVDLGSHTQLAELEENGVKGRYVSVERLTILDNGNIEWRMATSSTPGGNIPLFVSERTMPSKISDDVPLFLNYIKSLRTRRAAQSSH